MLRFFALAFLISSVVKADEEPQVPGSCFRCSENDCGFCESLHVGASGKQYAKINLSRCNALRPITWISCCKDPHCSLASSFSHLDPCYGGTLDNSLDRCERSMNALLSIDADFPELELDFYHRRFSGSVGVEPEDTCGDVENAQVCSGTGVCRQSFKLRDCPGWCDDASDCHQYPKENEEGCWSCEERRCVEKRPRQCGGYSGGDPHFKTWKGKKFDYHGVCDLVLLSSTGFGEGRGLRLHVRTRNQGVFSSISEAAIQIGSNVLEVGGKGIYHVNGIENAGMPNELDGFPVSYFENPDGKRHEFTIDIGHDDSIVIKAYRKILFVTVKSDSAAKFGDSVGLFGNFTTGSMIARDGTSLLKDPWAFGEEWQVRDTEPILFHERREPQFPQHCIPAPPKKAVAKGRRRLGESLHEEDAKEACSRWGEDEDICILDVLATGDLEIASAGIY